MRSWRLCRCLNYYCSLKYSSFFLELRDAHLICPYGFCFGSNASERCSDCCWHQQGTWRSLGLWLWDFINRLQLTFVGLIGKRHRLCRICCLAEVAMNFAETDVGVFVLFEPICSIRRWTYWSMENLFFLCFALDWDFCERWPYRQLHFSIVEI